MNFVIVYTKEHAEKRRVTSFFFSMSSFSFALEEIVYYSWLLLEEQYGV